MPSSRGLRYRSIANVASLPDLHASKASDSLCRLLDFVLAERGLVERVESLFHTPRSAGRGQPAFRER
jgi:hypothetical protein